MPTSNNHEESDAKALPNQITSSHQNTYITSHLVVEVINGVKSISSPQFEVSTIISGN